jgi:hypothetical protein
MKKCDGEGCSCIERTPEEIAESLVETMVNYDPQQEFLSKLEQVINSFSIENESNTPDFILAKFLRTVLDAWATATKEREAWYGKELKI